MIVFSIAFVINCAAKFIAILLVHLIRFHKTTCPICFWKSLLRSSSSCCL